MTLAKAENLIAQEVRWHEDNTGVSRRGHRFEDGFVAGLKQALTVLKLAKVQSRLVHPRGDGVTVAPLQRLGFVRCFNT
jgi:hypothetical protein